MGRKAKFAGMPSTEENVKAFYTLHHMGGGGGGGDTRMHLGPNPKVSDPHHRKKY